MSVVGKMLEATIAIIILRFRKYAYTVQWVPDPPPQLRGNPIDKFSRHNAK